MQLLASALRSLRISVISALTNVARIFNAEITEIRRDRREESNPDQPSFLSRGRKKLHRGPRRNESDMGLYVQRYFDS